MLSIRRRQPELGEDRGDVLLDGAVRHHQGPGDADVGASFRHQPEHLAFARGEAVERSPPPAGQQLRYHLRVEHCSTAGYTLAGIDEVTDVGDPLLQEVADSFAVVRQQLGRIALLDVLREHEDGLRRVFGADRHRSLDPFVGERRRQAHVEHHEIGSKLVDGGQQRGGVDELANNLVAGFAEETNDPFAQQHRVLDDDDPHRHRSCHAAGGPGGGHWSAGSGSSASTVVGPPTGLATRRRPSSAATRDASPASPPPCSMSAPPTPSSRTSTRSMLPATRASTLITDALLCLAAFVSASAITKYAADSIVAGGRLTKAMLTSTGIGLRAVSDDSAASSPRSVNTAGWMPRTRLRRSTTARFESSWARSTKASTAGSASVSASSFWRAMPRSIASVTSGACTPSCKSRSMRRRSVSAVSTDASRLTVSVSTR